MRYTRDEYLVREDLPETKSEYILGDIRSMSGASPEHATICFNLGTEIGLQIRAAHAREAGAIFAYGSMLAIATTILS